MILDMIVTCFSDLFEGKCIQELSDIYIKKKPPISQD